MAAGSDADVVCADARGAAVAAGTDADVVGADCSPSLPTASVSATMRTVATPKYGSHVNRAARQNMNGIVTIQIPLSTIAVIRSQFAHRAGLTTLSPGGSGVGWSLCRWHEGRSPPQGGYSPPKTAASMGQNGSRSLDEVGDRPCSSATTSIEGKEESGVTIGLDVGDRYTHVHALGAGGEVVRDQRIRTTALALSSVLGDLPRARVVLEAGPRCRG